MGNFHHGRQDFLRVHSPQFRSNAVDYFLHPLNPFRTQVNTSNEVLGMQGINIPILMQQGINGEPLSPMAAETEYNNALSRLTGEQYELLPPADPALYTQPTPLYTIRHVFRTSPTSAKILGIYYIVEGCIYKGPRYVLCYEVEIVSGLFLSSPLTQFSGYFAMIFQSAIASKD